MIGIILTILVFWYYPMKDIRKISAITGIGTDPEHRIDAETVEAWKKGRIRARKLWSGFGTVIVFAAMLNWVLGVISAGAQGTDSDMMILLLTRAELLCMAVGVAGIVYSLFVSAANNKKHLGQLRVRM